MVPSVDYAHFMDDAKMNAMSEATRDHARGRFAFRSLFIGEPGLGTKDVASLGLKSEIVFADFAKIYPDCYKSFVNLTDMGLTFSKVRFGSTAEVRRISGYVRCVSDSG